MSADSTTRATGRSLPGGSLDEVSALPSPAVPSRGRRWIRRLAVAVAVMGAAAAVRERRLAANARRFGLPG